MSDNDMPPSWERQTLERILRDAFAEQRRARKWNIFYRGLTMVFLFSILALMAQGYRHDGAASMSSTRHTALVEMRGVIDSSGNASADRVNGALEDAFKSRNSVGVILRINSPGGSPVQAGRIYDEIRRLRTLYPNKPIYAVVEDLCASGGYYVAAATDKIIVDKASIVGSIGVIMDGFGFTGAMEKLGVERRALHAGTNKAFLDPYSPANPDQVRKAQDMLAQIHGQFIKAVRDGRGSRLKEGPDTFSGLMWTGEESIRQGLTDQLGNADQVARDIFKAEDIVDYTQQDNLAERFAKRFGAAASELVLHTLSSDATPKLVP